jgi:hypothetical protein
MKKLIYLFVFFSFGATAQIIGVNPNSLTYLDSISFSTWTSNPFWSPSNTNQTINNQYILNPSQNAYSINIGSLVSGSYNIILICDGDIKDVQLLTKN